VTRRRPSSFRCFFVATIAGWFVAVYAPSALIALTGTSPLAAGRSLPAAVFAIADEVAPAAKIGFALLFVPMLLLARRVAPPRIPVVVLDILSSCAAIVLVLALLPAEWSRGFGIGLTGARFAPGPLLMYLAGAILAGLGFSQSEQACLARRPPQPGR
jgi:hypothetical protein